MAAKRPSPSDPHPPSSGDVPGMEEMLDRARRVTKAAKAPVVGGIAVVLHGWGRFTRDLYSDDFKATHELLERAGIRWNASRREHLIDGVPVHLVGPDSLGGPPRRISTIRGVKVISLADLIRGKLTVGLESITRARDIADVIELIRVIPLKRDFAPRLPRELRRPFKELVEQVHGRRRAVVPALRFWDRT
jgi:hypothetical protein